ELHDAYGPETDLSSLTSRHAKLKSSAICRAQTNISFTTWPCTSVSRISRPPNGKVSFVWSSPRYVRDPDLLEISGGGPGLGPDVTPTFHRQEGRHNVG